MYTTAETIGGTSSGTSRTRVALGLTLSALSAVLATLSFGPYHLSWLIFVAFVPMVVAQHVLLPARWSGAALAVGIGGYVTGYMYDLVDPSFARWMWLIPLALAVPLLLGGRVDRALHEATAYRWFVIATPLGWTAIDFVRGGLPMVATRASPAYAVYDAPSLLQPVSITGIAGLNLLILAVNWTLAGAVIDRLDWARSLGPTLPRRTRGWPVLAAALVVWAATSLALLDDPGPRVRVAAIQPGTASRDAEELRRNVEQTRRAAADGAELIVWREKALRFDPTERHTTELRALAREIGAYIAIGYGIDTPDGQRNEATVIAPDGSFLGAYGKQHPALMFDDDRTSISRGDFPVYDTAIGRLATIICYDLDFTDTAREMARRGAQLLAVPSWDPQGDATKHYPLLVFRAIENRLTMVKAETMYDSAIIDPYGRILDRVVSPHGSRATLVADVPLGSGKSAFVTLGNSFGWLTAALAACLLLLAGRQHHNTTAPQPRVKTEGRAVDQQAS
jgi:apolipoprotein N-acyltransferase